MKTNILLRMLGEEKRNELESFVFDVSNRDYLEIVNQNGLSELFDKIIPYLDNFTSDELMNIRLYTGYQFKNINAILRGTWNYDEIGILNDEVRIKFQNLANQISNLINRFPSLNIDFTTYRGVDINSFKKYGITSLYEVLAMKGKFMYEEGFTSTSVMKETSYFGKTQENGSFCNIEIKYLIPRESADGALLANEVLSYSPNQNEYLLNSGSLVKIIDVKVDLDKNEAQLIAVLIPKRIWDLNVTREVPTSVTR